MIETTEKLLVEAAVFLAQDGGAPGFLDRFSQAVNGDARLVSQALDRALTAQALAGHASVRLEPGDLHVETTSAGASLTACALTTPDGRVTAAVRLIDAQRRPVEGAALQIVSTEDKNWTVVTNIAGWVHIDAAGPSLQITVGHGHASERTAPRAADCPDAAAGVIQLPRLQRRHEYKLAAAHDSGEAETDESGGWRVEAGGVEFLCLERKGGYDLTVLVAGVTAEFAQAAIGTYGVRFRTQDRKNRSRNWIVPLAPSPLGLAGSLYSTDEHQIDVPSIDVRSTEQLMAAPGGQLEEVIRWSVRHSDTVTVWAAVCHRLPTGRSRAVLEAALAEHEHSQ